MDAESAYSSFHSRSVSRIFQALPSSQVRHTEILVIDDNSSDDTADIIERLREAGYNVHLHVRTTERGLSSAVLHGFTLARGSKLLVMDADLQHPPESVPTLLEALEARRDMDGEVPGPLFALGTRYGKGIQMDKDWPVYRRIISWGARMLSRPLTNAQDPMGGFFALRKTLVRCFARMHGRYYWLILLDSSRSSVSGIATSESFRLQDWPGATAKDAAYCNSTHACTIWLRKAADRVIKIGNEGHDSICRSATRSVQMAIRTALPSVRGKRGSHNRLRGFLCGRRVYEEIRPAKYDSWSCFTSRSD